MLREARNRKAIWVNRCRGCAAGPKPWRRNSRSNALLAGESDRVERATGPGSRIRGAERGHRCVRARQGFAPDVHPNRRDEETSIAMIEVTAVNGLFTAVN